VVWNKQHSVFHQKTKPEKEAKPKNENETIQEFLDDLKACRVRHPGQIEVRESVIEKRNQYTFIKAGRKFSKTTCAIDIAWELAKLGPNKVGYLCYPTIAQGTEVIWEERRLQTCDRKDDMMFDKYVEKMDDNKHMMRFKNGSFVKLIGTWTEARGRGTQPDFIIYDEFQDCNPEFVEAMDSNLSAKPDAIAVMMGTPPKKRNHFEDWMDRIANHPKGKVLSYTSYANTSLPHLKEWLDNKNLELIKAGKEDVWLREYMAELCYASSERVLPQAKFTEKDEIENLARLFDYSNRIPFMAISCHPTYFCCILGVLIAKQTVFVLDHLIVNQIWDKAFSEMVPLIAEKAKSLQDMCGKKMRKLVWDESKSFVDIVSGFTTCQKDPKWQDRGIPILREMMVKDKIKFSREIADFGLECQNLLVDETEKEVQKNYPHICTLSMLVNEYFSQEKVCISQFKPFDKFDAFREMGIPCPPKRNPRSFLRF
jgi:hypothetical protein